MIRRHDRIACRSRWGNALVVFLFTILLVGCDEKPIDRSVPDSTAQATTDDTAAGSNPIDTTPTTSPSGRTELPTINTAAPSLFVTLPDGYAVRNDTGLDDDILFIYRADDPLVQGDSASVPKGILRIVIGDTTIAMKAPGSRTEPYRSMVGSYPLEWRTSIEPIALQRKYYSYEGEIPSFFARYGDDATLSGLNLHLYVGGSDTSIVNQLLRVVATLSPRQ
jgi:hypothetical protein